MAQQEKGENKGKGQGFAGLSSLVSDMEAVFPSPAKPKAAEFDNAPSTAQTVKASQSTQPEPQTTKKKSDQTLSQPSSGSSMFKWVVGVILVIWFVNTVTTTPSPPKPTYTPQAKNTAPSYSPSPVQAQIPSRPTEEKPPVGKSHNLSSSQIRYCLAEDIRIESAKTIVNTHSQSEVDRFNAMVSDFNRRCTNFRYRREALESARREIEPYRSLYQAEGKNR